MTKTEGRTMELVRFASIEDFYERTETFLLAREAEHNLILGIAAGMAHNPGGVDFRPYLACVERNGEVVAAALMTPLNLILSHVAADKAITLIAGDLRTQYETLPGVVGSVPFSKAFVEEWQRLTGQPYTLAISERIYQLERVNPVTGVQGSIRRANGGDRDLLYRWLAAFNAEALGEKDTSRLGETVDRFLNSETAGIGFWESKEEEQNEKDEEEEGEQPEPVCMAGYSRPTPNGISVLAVYTPPEHRGKGYASACVASLSQMLLEEGRRYCFLYTDLANPTTNHIYQAIGYNPVCDAEMYRFRAVP